MISLLAAPPLLGLFSIFGQTLEWTDLGVIGLLVVLEGVLSIDNALVLGLLAKRLPKHERAKALSYGLIGAFVFRVIAICTASFLLKWTIVKFIGGAYLVYIAVRHLFFESKEEAGDDVKLDEHGHPIIVDEKTGDEIDPERQELEIEERVPVYMKPETRKRLGFAAFWPTVAVIELTDVAFAVDSILAAMALAGSRDEKLWVVISGGVIGVVLMRFAAAMFIYLLDRFPRFEVSAYLLVVVIGLKLLADWGLNSDWSFDKHFASSWVGSMKPQFEQLETNRREYVFSYEKWLKENWVFGLHGGHEEHAHDKIPQAPHLLNFHDLRRPECMGFWLIMVGCFALGFSQRKDLPEDAKSAKKPPEAAKK
jgi:YkoY family integral membrane protein